MKTVMTNGCFEVLHGGHVDFLKRARRLGDRLIVCLNSDVSVAALKGKGHPLQPEHLRKLALEELRCVDEVILFSDVRVTNMLLTIRPQIWVKGGDYTLDTLDKSEREAADRIGAQIVLLPVVHEVHTSALLAHTPCTVQDVCGDVDGNEEQWLEE